MAFNTPEEARVLVEQATKMFTDQGLIIEAGWAGLRAYWLDTETPSEQVRDMRWAFFAGAQHLFSSIMTVLEPDGEPTEKDLQRMGLIAEELDRFAEEMKKVLPTQGKA